MLEISIEEAKGKIIQEVAWGLDGNLYVTFIDSTFTVITARQVYDKPPEVVQGELDLDKASERMLISLGVMTKEEIENKIKEKDELKARLLQERDIRTYRRLKAQYGYLDNQ